MVDSSSMVVDVVYVAHVSIIETENYSPVCAYRNSPEKPRQNIPQLHNVFCDHTAWVVVFVQPFQSLVAYRPNRAQP
jgi:hypothetical protein